MKNLYKSRTGAADQIFATVFFIAAFALIAAGFLHFNSLSNPIQQDITALHIKLDDEENYANLMQSYTDNTNSETMSNLLIESIVANQFLKFDTVLSAKMQRDYPKGTYWEYGIFKIKQNDKFDTSSGEIVYAHTNSNFKSPQRSPGELETMARFSSDPFGEDPSISYMQIPFIKDNYNHYMVFKFGGSKFRGAE